MATSLDEPRFIVGIRTENTRGLTEAGENDISEIYEDGCDQQNLKRRVSNASALSMTSGASSSRLGGANGSTAWAFSVVPRHSALSQASGNLQSEVSFNSLRTSLAYSDASSARSSLLWGLVKGKRKGHRSPTVRSAPSFGRLRGSPSSASGASAPTSFRLLLDACTQTTLCTEEISTQTEAMHVPSSHSSMRPPLDPTASLRSSCRSGCTKSTGRGGSIMNGPNGGLPTSPSGSRRSSRSQSVGSRMSGWSSASEDLVIRHFQATPMQTMAYGIGLLTEHCNTHMNNSCCSWHATVHALGAAVILLRDKGCKKPGWVPSSGWQCTECLALNDIDEDECSICFGDRVLDKAPQGGGQRSSDGGVSYLPLPRSSSGLRGMDLPGEVNIRPI